MISFTLSTESPFIQIVSELLILKYIASGRVVTTVVHLGSDDPGLSRRMKLATNESLCTSSGISSQPSNQKHTSSPLLALISCAIVLLCSLSGWGMKSARHVACCTRMLRSGIERKRENCWNSFLLAHCWLACHMRVVLPDPGKPLITRLQPVLLRSCGR